MYFRNHTCLLMLHLKINLHIIICNYIWYRRTAQFNLVQACMHAVKCDIINFEFYTCICICMHKRSMMCEEHLCTHKMCAL